MSVPAGYPSWSKLLADIASDLQLDSAREPDLAGLAQFHLNKRGHVRTELTALITKTFAQQKTPPEEHRILARLPIRTIWTTNYDCLMEYAWSAIGKSYYSRHQSSQITSQAPAGTRAELFKMHGCVSAPGEVVLARDDYELFRKKRPGFLQLLSSELFSKTFLFLGLSFSDPNILHLFSTIRELFTDSMPTHYAILKRPQKKDFSGKNSVNDFEYQSRRFDLWVDDLHKRYGIDSFIVDDYQEIRQFLSDLEESISRRSYFVSGTYPPSTTIGKGAVFLDNLSKQVGRVIAQRQRNLVSGYGLGVGSGVLSGAIDAWYTSGVDFSQRLLIRPFPQGASPTKAIAFKSRYREDMIAQTGICIFIAGFTEKGDNASGVVEEYEIARKARKIVIPIGASGGAATELFTRTVADFEDIFRAKTRRTPLKKLGDGLASVDELVSALEELLDQIDPADS